jgi:hypothetical protein
VKTEDLIRALAADDRPGSPLGRSLAFAMLAGGLVSGIAFFLTLGFRPDIDGALHTVRFLFKFAVTLSLAAAATALVWRVGRPAVPLARSATLLAVPVLLLVAAVLIELTVVPEGLWAGRLVGRNWLHCLLSIPSFSLPVMAALLYALREGAPSSPTLAGAAAGLVSAGIAATYYAANCPDDSPLFVATWYTLAVGIVCVAGALIGRRLLRW